MKRLLLLCFCLLVSAGFLSAADTEKPLDLKWAVSERQGLRMDMEDAYTAKLIFNQKNNEAFFGIFDGHGGETAAIAAAQGLQTSLRQKEGQGPRHDGFYMRRPVRRRFDHELPRREQPGGVCA